MGAELTSPSPTVLMPSSYYSAAIIILSWMTSSLTQPAPKRAAAMACEFVSLPPIASPSIPADGPMLL